MSSAAYSGRLHVVNIPAAADPACSRRSCLSADALFMIHHGCSLKRDILNLVRTRMDTHAHGVPSAFFLPTPSLFPLQTEGVAG